MAAMGTIGLGSDGALNYDIIDQLREVDEDIYLKPIDEDAAEVNTKKEDLKEITDKLDEFEEPVDKLAGEQVYLERNIESSGTSVKVDTFAGVNEQEFTLNVTQLAQNDIHRSSGFDSKETAVASADDTLEMKISGIVYNIDVSKGDTLEDIASEINAVAGQQVTASILTTGADGTGNKLIIKSDATGNAGNIKMKSTGGGDILNDLGLSEVQNAQNAKFEYNGIAMTRSSNEITDIIPGVEMSLTELGSTTVTIEQNTTLIKEEIENFVTAYNELVKLLDESTDYDVDSGESGTFQGVSEITNIESELRNLLFNISDNGKSLQDYGFSITDNGVMSFSESEFDEAIIEDGSTELMEETFRGISEAQATSYTSGKVTSSDIKLESGDLVINGMDVIVDLNGGSSEANAKILSGAIEDLGLRDIEVNVYLDTISLSSSSGRSISITGDEDKLKQTGFSETTISPNYEYTDGVFTEISDYISSLTSGEDATLNVYESSLSTQQKNLVEEYTKAEDKLDAKYDTMIARYIAYDRMIGQINAQGDALAFQIESSFSDN